MKQHLKIIGFILLIVSTICLITTFIIPFLSLSNTTKGFSMTVVFVLGEATFILSLTLLGKELWGKIKQTIGKFFSTKKHE
jgi:hypothetical protein